MCMKKMGINEENTCYVFVSLVLGPKTQPITSAATLYRSKNDVLWPFFSLNGDIDNGVKWPSRVSVNMDFPMFTWTAA